MARSIRPARVSQARSRSPLRWLSRSGLRTPAGAPVSASTCIAISRSAAKASISRTRSASAVFSIRSKRAILSSVIVISSFRFSLQPNPNRRPAVTAPGARYAREGFARPLSGTVLHHASGHDALLEYSDRKALVEPWYARDPEALKNVDELLATAGLSMDAVMAQTLAKKLE